MTIIWLGMYTYLALCSAIAIYPVFVKIRELKRKWKKEEKIEITVIHLIQVIIFHVPLLFLFLIYLLSLLANWLITIFEKLVQYNFTVVNIPFPKHKKEEES